MEIIRKISLTFYLFKLYSDLYCNWYYYVLQPGYRGWASASNLIHVINKDKKVTYMTLQKLLQQRTAKQKKDTYFHYMSVTIPIIIILNLQLTFKTKKFHLLD